MAKSGATSKPFWIKTFFWIATKSHYSAHLFKVFEGGGPFLGVQMQEEFLYDYMDVIKNE